MVDTRLAALAALALALAGCAEPTDPVGSEAEIGVEDQTAYADADGTAKWIQVAGATADQAYEVQVKAAAGQVLGTAGPFEEERQDFHVVLDEGLGEDTTATVELVAAEGGDTLATANASITVATLEAQLTTNFGNITILLYGDRTPQTVQNLGSLAQDGYFDGTRFHRVIDDFVIQGGDPLTKDTSNKDRWGTGGPGYTIRDEFACQDGTISTKLTGYRSQEEPCDGHGGLAVSHGDAGMVSMANRGEPKTGGSQFFILDAPQPRLDGTHPVFGTVTEGMDTVEEISSVPTDDRDRPTEDVIVHEVTVDGPLPGVDLRKFNQG